MRFECMDECKSDRFISLHLNFVNINVAVPSSVLAENKHVHARCPVLPGNFSERKVVAKASGILRPTWKNDRPFLSSEVEEHRDHCRRHVVINYSRKQRNPCRGRFLQLRHLRCCYECPFEGENVRLKADFNARFDDVMQMVK